MNNDKQEMVNHPSHYSWLKDLCGVEPIDICQHFGFNVGCALKYLMRNGKTENGMTSTEQRIQDLLKARFYINYEIGTLRRQLVEAEMATDKQPSQPTSSVKDVILPSDDTTL